MGHKSKSWRTGVPSQGNNTNRGAEPARSSGTPSGTSSDGMSGGASRRAGSSAKATDQVKGVSVRSKTKETTGYA